ncbi:unnamed protein product [Lasius platythorax]|uniref:BESS domain-containing protein n=1 Tax=Lasius platythorax TaxID=488582 RepID=A0AAV2N0U8_9HYME
MTVAIERPTLKPKNSQSIVQPISQSILSYAESSNELSKSRSRPRSVSSPVMSSSSSLSNMCNEYNASPSTSARIPKKRKAQQNEDAYIGAIESIAQSLKASPTSVSNVTDNTNPVDICMNFLGSLIKNLKLPEIRLDIMNTLIQTVIEASAIDLERSKKQ